MNKTKIVCTIGPSSWDPLVMEKIIKNGMTCARVNGAFADPKELDKVANLVRNVSDKVALMVDVKGPEIRLNKFPEPIKLKPGDEVVIGNDDKSKIYPANYKNTYSYLKPGQRIVIGDGDLEMKVIKIEGDKMICKVVFGVVLKPGKAMNLPGANYTTDILTEKDKVNLEHAIKTGWDMVSASFIQNAKSAQTVKEFIKKHNSDMQLIAKIEDQEGIDNIDEILKIVDGVMIARGGLGVELGVEKTPIATRYLMEKCTKIGMPVITATQMLESMTEEPRPTRAEVSDVATAVFLGSDSVMLSGESSAGKYPVEAVKVLKNVSKEVEPIVKPKIKREKGIATTMTDALSRAAAEMSLSLGDKIKAVIILTKSGNAVKSLGRHSIKHPVYAFCSTKKTIRSLMISKGVTKAFCFDEKDELTNDKDDTLEVIKRKISDFNLGNRGDKFLVVAKDHENERFFPGIFDIVEI